MTFKSQHCSVALPYSPSHHCPLSILVHVLKLEFDF